MPKSLSRPIASRRSGLLLTVGCLLSLIAPTRLPADEPTLTEAARTAEKGEAAPRRRFELSLTLVELDKSLITDGESALWKLVPWTKVSERYASAWSGFGYQTQFWYGNIQPVDPSLWGSFEDGVRKQVQEGHGCMSFTIPQDAARRFVEGAVQDRTGKLIRERTNIVDEGSAASFDLAHHPLSVKQGMPLLRPHSRTIRQFRVGPRSFREGIHLAITSKIEVITPLKTGWSWLDNKVPPSRQIASGSAQLAELVPRGQALVVFNTGSGDSDMEPGKPSLLVIVPKEIDAVALPDPAAKIGDAAAQPAQPAERLGYGSPVAPPTGVSPATVATPTSQPEFEATSRRVIPAVASDAQPSRPRRRDQPELKALHDEVRGLREDVRRLSELLEKRLAVKDMSREAPGHSESVPQADTRGKFEATVQPNALLNFTAPWCGPCQKMQPLIDKLVREGCPIQTLDVDQDAAVVKRFNVTSIPCFIRLRDGKEVDRATGMTNEPTLRRLAQRTSHIPAALEKQVSLSFEEERLCDVLKKVGDLAGFNIVLDARGFEEEGLKKTHSVSIVIDGITARSALRLILEPLNLATIEQDEVLLVTSRQRTKGEQTVDTYQVADLFVRLTPPEKDSPEQTDRCLKRIGEFVQATVAPDSWDTVGGQGSLRYYGTTRSLIVRQTSDVHTEIAKLLDQLRGLKLELNDAGQAKDAIPPLPRSKADVSATDGVVKLSVVGKRVKPISLLVGQQGELQFANRIRSVEGHDGAILQLSRVAGESLLVQGASVGTTLLRVSLDGVAEPFEVIVVVNAFVQESNITQVSLRADDAQPRKVSLRVNRSLEVTVDDWLTRVDGFDPHLVDVKAVEKHRLRFTGSTVGTTTATLTTRSGKSHTVEVTVLAADAWKQHPLVRQRIAAREDLPKPIRVPLKGERPIELDADISRISIGFGDVIDVRHMDPRHVVVIGKQAGLARLTFWFEKTAEPRELFVRVLPFDKADAQDGHAAAKDRAPSEFEVRTYSVADLVVPLTTEGNGKSIPKADDWLKLIDLITTQCDPECWTARGGTSSIQTYEKTLSLAIRARTETHEKIIAVLDAKRREQDVQVSVQVRLIEFADETELKKAGLELNFDTATRSMKLDAKSAETFIAACGAKGEFAPKLTMFNGQISTIRTEYPGGVRLELHLRGLVSQDRKSVCLGAALNPDSLVNDLVRRSSTLSDGEYLLIDRTDEAYRAKSEKPQGRMLILVQPRILVQEEEAELLGLPAKEGAVRDVPEK